MICFKRLLEIEGYPLHPFLKPQKLRNIFIPFRIQMWMDAFSRINWSKRGNLSSYKVAFPFFPQKLNVDWNTQNSSYLVRKVLIQLKREPWSSGFMEDDSCLRGHEFESQRCILDGHFSHWFVEKIVCSKRPKINEKEAGVGPFKKIEATNFSQKLTNCYPWHMKYAW